MACCALKLSQCVKNQIVYKYASSYSVVFNRYYCIKNDNEDKHIKAKTEEENAKDKLIQDVNVKEATKEHKLSEKQSEFLSEESKEAAKKKLLSLLSEVNVVSDQPSRFNLNLARPLKRPSKKERFPDLLAKKSPPDEEIKLAVKAVASNIKGDPQTIESELQQKLTSINLIKEHTEEVSKREEDSAEKQVDSILNEEASKHLMSSVEKIASTVTESSPQSVLTNRLLRLALDSKISTEKRKSVSETLSGMKTEGKSSDIQEQKRATDWVSSSRAKFELKRTADERGQSKPRYELKRVTDQIDTSRTKSVPVRPQRKQRIELFGSSPLGIFPSPADETFGAKNALWEKLQEKEMRLLVQFAPVNAFEEMILWTEQGKHWKLPIDNEIDMGAEEDVGFHEHVFLERHLDGFPTKGPIRHFMELVVVGLSKNHYITVDRKIENINWFRNYFKEKEDILKEVAVLEG